MSFLARSRLFQVVSGRFLLVVGRFRSFLAHCRLFQVVPRFSKYVTMLVLDNIDRLEETLPGKCLILNLKEHIIWFEEKGSIFQKWQNKAKKSKGAKKMYKM